MQAAAARALAESVHAGYVQDTVLRSLRVPSPQTDLLEDDPQIKAFIADFFAPEVRGLGLDVSVDPWGNALATAGPASQEGGMLLVVYAMTHPPTIMPDPYSGTVVDGAAAGVPGRCARGRGACEQKGALGAALGAVRALLHGKVALRAPLHLLAVTAGETGRPVAITRALEHFRLRPAMGIVACGTDNAICLGQKGRIDVTITIRGWQSHSSTPWLGLNALEGAKTVLDRILSRKELEHPHLGKITLTPTALETSPRATHTVPGEARLVVDRRLAPGDDPQAAFAGVRDLVGSVPPFEIACELGPYMYAYELAREARLPGLLAEAIRAVSRREPEYTYLHGGLDAGFLNARGIESLMFGPGEAKLAHTADDIVAMASCVEGAKYLAYACARALA